MLSCMKLPVVCFNVNFVAEFWKINHLVTSELVAIAKIFQRISSNI